MCLFPPRTLRMIAQENCDNVGILYHVSAAESSLFEFRLLASLLRRLLARARARAASYLSTRSPWSHRVHFYDDGMQRSPPVLIYLGPLRSHENMYVVLRLSFFAIAAAFARLQIIRSVNSCFLHKHARASGLRRRMEFYCCWECCFTALIAPHFHLQSRCFNGVQQTVLDLRQFSP